MPVGSHETLEDFARAYARVFLNLRPLAAQAAHPRRACFWLAACAETVAVG